MYGEGDPEELWSAFKTTIHDVAGGCLGTHRRVKKNFVSQGTLDTIDQSRRARLTGRAELFRELRRKTARALRVDKEAYVRGICEGVEHHLWSSDSRPAYRGIRALRSSKPIPWCTVVRAEGGRLLTEESEVRPAGPGQKVFLTFCVTLTFDLDLRNFVRRTRLRSRVYMSSLRTIALKL